MPTLFILIAPTAVGFIAYIRIAQSWDSFAVFLLFIGYFFVVLLFFLRKSFFNIRFFFIMGGIYFLPYCNFDCICACVPVTASVIFKYLAFILFGIALVMIGFVSLETILRIQTGEICVNEDE